MAISIQNENFSTVNAYKAKKMRMIVDKELNLGTRIESKMSKVGSKVVKEGAQKNAFLFFPIEKIWIFNSARAFCQPHTQKL